MSMKKSIIHLVYEGQPTNSYNSSSSECDKENTIPAFPATEESQNFLKGSFTFTPRFLHKDVDTSFQTSTRRWSRTALAHKYSNHLMGRESSRNMKRRALKRKLSTRSHLQVIPLSDRLVKERGEIESADGRISPNDPISNDPSTVFDPHSTTNEVITESIRNIVRAEMKSHLSALSKLSQRFPKKSYNRSKQSMKNDSSTENHNESQTNTINESSNVDPEGETDTITTDQKLTEESEDRSSKSQNIEAADDQSETPDDDMNYLSPEKILLTDENGLTSSQRSFRTIIQLQIEIWKKLLRLKESTEILEKIAFNRQSENDGNELHQENEISSAVTADNICPDSLYNSSLKAVFSQLENDQGQDSPLSSLNSSDLVAPTFSCYRKMNEIEHRLSDVELRMASIHQILQGVRQQQYKELRCRQMSYLKTRKLGKLQMTHNTSTREIVGDGNTITQESIVDGDKRQIKSDPPTTCNSQSAMASRELNPYDESYYEWRQYHMNLLHYKKSERTIALNRRPTLHIMRPPIFEFVQNTENRYRTRVKKPFFILTPSRTNSLWK